jgi:hypothetical protein
VSKKTRRMLTLGTAEATPSNLFGTRCHSFRCARDFFLERR